MAHFPVFLFEKREQGKFKESVTALQHGLSIDSNNAAQIKEKTDTELCVRKIARVTELVSQVSVSSSLAASGPVQPSLVNSVVDGCCILECNHNSRNGSAHR